MSLKMLNGNDLHHELLLTTRQKMQKMFQLTQLGITAAASAIDAGIQTKIHGSRTATLVISNKEMNGILKIVQPFEESNILLKRVT